MTYILLFDDCLIFIKFVPYCYPFLSSVVSLDELLTSVPKDNAKNKTLRAQRCSLKSGCFKAFEKFAGKHL